MSPGRGATGTLALQAVRSAANGIIFHHLLLLQRGGKEWEQAHGGLRSCAGAALS